MRLKERALHIVEELKKLYPQAECSLRYERPYQLLFSTRLAAQCTDARVNIVTKDLYRTYTSLEDFANCDIKDLEEMIRPCGLFHTKARDLQACAAALLERFDGEVPDTMEELLTLPGVGRKTANLILGDVFHKPAVVVDTHCARLSNRLGLVTTKDPKKIEMRLRQIVPPDEQNMLCHRFVWHGRAVCPARGPKCDECVLAPYCKTAEERK